MGVRRNIFRLDNQADVLGISYIGTVGHGKKDSYLSLGPSTQSDLLFYVREGKLRENAS
jgi:hypothetical protein